MIGSVLPLQMILFNLFSPHIFTNKFDIDIMYRLIKFLVPLKLNISDVSLASVKDCPRNLPLEFGQNRLSYSWDIPDVDKYR